MKTRYFRALALAAVVCASAPLAKADAAAVIAKARARLGTEEVLSAMKSVHFTGTVESVSGDTKTSGSIEMFFQKPILHRSIIRTGDRVEITGLDNYESWQRVNDAKDPNRWQLTLFPKEQTKALRANTWETLEFYRGIEKAGGRVLDLGEAKVDDIACYKLGFEHDKDIVFYRYFEQATGRLVQTETAQATTREEGEIVSGGIRFPKSIVSKLKPVEGKERTVTVTFEKISVNEVFPASDFAVPPLSSPSLPAAVRAP